MYNQAKDMNISKHKVAAIHYTLRGSNGTVLDSSEGQEPLYYLHGENSLIPGMEEGLEVSTEQINDSSERQIRNRR